MQKSGSYWYQDCGSAIERRIVYNDEDDYVVEDDAFGRAFARLDFMRDLDRGVAFRPQEIEEEDATAPKARSFPVRMVRGLWNRIRRQ